MGGLVRNLPPPHRAPESTSGPSGDFDFDQRGDAGLVAGNPEIEQALQERDRCLDTLWPSTFQGGPPQPNIEDCPDPSKDFLRRLEELRRQLYEATGGAPNEPPAPPVMLGNESRDRARAVQRGQAPVEPDHPLRQLREAQRRQLNQMNLFHSSDAVQFVVQDVSADHGQAVFLAAASKGVGLLPEGADALLFSPQITNEENERNLRRAHVIEGPDEATFEETIDGYEQFRLGYVDALASDVESLTQEARSIGDGDVRIVNQSFGRTPEKYAEGLARRMLRAEPGTPLYDKVADVLGNNPNYWEWAAGKKPKLTREENNAVRRDITTLKQQLIYPALRSVHQTDPEFRREEGAARLRLQTAYDEAASAGLLFIRSSGNNMFDAVRDGGPDASIDPANGIPGPFDVASVVIGSPADPTDDRISPWASSLGPNEGAGVGFGVPVGTPKKDGYASDESGSSFAAPSVAAIGYLVSAELRNAHPESTPRDVVLRTFEILQDPRVLVHIPVASSIVPGQVDPVRALMVARAPEITEAQIQRNLDRLRQFPDSKFTLGPDGNLRIQADEKP
jgi:hypothetical protein